MYVRGLFSCTFDTQSAYTCWAIGASDYDVSEDYIVHTTKDPELSEAWNTKQNVIHRKLHINPETFDSLVRLIKHNPVFSN